MFSEFSTFFFHWEFIVINNFYFLARKQVEIRKRNSIIERELSHVDERIFQLQDILKETETILVRIS